MLTSGAGMTCHARLEFLDPKLQHFLNLGIFNYNPGKTDNKFITCQLFLYSDIISTS